MEIPDAGLCDRCQHCKAVVSPRGSMFRRCLLHDRDPHFAKYPRVPVTNCGGYLKKADDEAQAAFEPALRAHDAIRRHQRHAPQPKTTGSPFSRTLAHYEANAASFWQGTKDHDVSENRAALLDNLEGSPPLTILDLGCGPGRDLAHFRLLGHEAVGLEGCQAFVDMARRHSGCEVLEQDFLSLSLRADRFDGVFANASLFHVPSAELPRVLRDLRIAMKPRGVLFSSNPRGQNEEGWHGDRYACYWDLERWTAVVAAAGFEEIAHYYRPPGKPRHEQPWLATVWRRASSAR